MISVMGYGFQGQGHHRCSAIEPAIGHMKMDGRLARNPLKGALGDALHAVMCGAGHNLRMILAKLRLLCARIQIALRDLLATLASPLALGHVALG